MAITAGLGLAAGAALAAAISGIIAGGGGALPRLETRRIGYMGDSRAFLSFTKPGGVNAYYRNVGVASWVQALSAGVLHVPISLINGVAGETTAQFDARIPAHITACKSEGCTRIMYVGGTNDPKTAPTDVDATMVNILRHIKMYNDNGIAVTIVSETPRGYGSSQYELSATAKPLQLLLHNRIEALRGTNPLLSVVDVWSQWIDTASGTNYYVKNGALTAVTQEGIHPSKLGAYLWASVMTPQLLQDTALTASILPAVETAYNATTAPTGSLISNGMMAGTTGTKESGASTITGAFVPTGYVLGGSNLAGLTIACSKVQIGGYDYFKLDFSGTATAASAQPLIQLKCPVPLTNLVVGDVVKLTTAVAFSGTGISNVAQALLLVPQYQLVYDTEDSVTTLPYPVLSGQTVMSREEPAYTHTSNTTQLELRFECQLLGTDTLTNLGQVINGSVYFGRAKVYKAA